MRPGYKERLQADAPATMITTTLRASRKMLEELEIYAAQEDDCVSNLVREGIIRVIDDRRADGEYMAAIDPDKLSPLRGAAQARVDQLETELVQAQTELYALGKENTNPSA